MWCLFLIWWHLTIIRWTAAAAKSLQSCPTLCDPTDGSPPGSPVPRILQARTLEWTAISFSSAWKWKLKVKSLSHVRLFIRWTSATLCTLSMDIMWLLTLLIVLFLLFAPWVCNCVMGFVSSCLKAFKLQMVAQTPATAATSCNYYLGPLDHRPSIWELAKYVDSPI